MREDKKLHYGFVLKLYFEDKAFGPGVAVLLRNIQKTGSLLGAAKEMQMAYSKAWKMIKNTEAAWGFALTDRETGGKDGGGSTLTPQAERLLVHYENFQKESEQSLDVIFEKYFSDSWITEIKSSAR